MHVTILLAHSSAAPSMRRVAEALHRYLPVPSDLCYVSPKPPAILRSRLPSALVHLLYVLHTHRRLQQAAERLPQSDVLHLVDHSESFLLPAVKAALRVAHCHDLIPLVEETVYRRPLSRRLGRWLYRLAVRNITGADGVVACSSTTAQDVKRLLGVAREKVKVAYHGVDTDTFAPLPEIERRYRREALGIPPEEIVLLHVGSNAPYKNVPAVLRAVAYVRDDERRVRLIKAGQPLSASLQRMAQALGIADHVHVEPNVDDARLRELYQVCDVLLFPSVREGFGLPVLEALACGTPAVIADTPALNEWASEVCLSAPPHDARSLAERVLQTLETGTSPTARTRYREFALQYDWRNITAQIVQAYREWAV